jgi:hypothetical protein
VVSSAKAMGSEPVRTAFRSPWQNGVAERWVRSPWQNGVAERWVGSCRRELLDHVIPLNERHLKRLLLQYVRTITTTELIWPCRNKRRVEESLAWAAAR